MIDWGTTGQVTINILSVMQGEGSTVFNYFFTMVIAFGFMAWGFGCLCNIISRS